MDDFTCFFCPATHTNHTLCLAHMESEHQEHIPVCCTDCWTTKPTVGKALVHLRDAHHTKCPMCPQRFDCFDILMRHFIGEHIVQTTESSEVRYYCTECFKYYPSWALLRDHIIFVHPDIWSELFRRLE